MEATRTLWQLPYHIFILTERSNCSWAEWRKGIHCQQQVLDLRSEARNQIERSRAVSSLFECFQYIGPLEETRHLGIMGRHSQVARSDQGVGVEEIISPWFILVQYGDVSISKLEARLTEAFFAWPRVQTNRTHLMSSLGPQLTKAIFLSELELSTQRIFGSDNNTSSFSSLFQMLRSPDGFVHINRELKMHIYSTLVSALCSRSRRHTGLFDPVMASRGQHLQASLPQLPLFTSKSLKHSR